MKNKERNKNRIHIEIVVSAVAFCVALASFVGLASFIQTIRDYIVINNEDDLHAMREDTAANYRLGANITLTKKWEPLGTVEKPFSGVLNGFGHTIQNLILEDSVSQNHGFFGVLTGIVIHCTFSYNQSYITSPNAFSFGPIAGLNKGSITTCFWNNAKDFVFEGDNMTIGGVSGTNCGRIKNTKVDGTFIIKGQSSSLNIGGLCGLSSGQSFFDMVKSSLNIKIDSESIAFLSWGGLCGVSRGKLEIQHALSSGTFRQGPSFSGNATIGGVIGKCEGSEQLAIRTSCSYADMSIVSSCSYLGGVIGECENNPILSRIHSYCIYPKSIQNPDALTKNSIIDTQNCYHSSGQSNISSFIAPENVSVQSLCFNSSYWKNGVNGHLEVAF